MIRLEILIMLYDRSGEIFTHEGDDAERFRRYLQKAQAELKELAARGQLLVVPDPFCGCYDATFQGAKMAQAMQAGDELVQSMRLYLSRPATA